MPKLSKTVEVLAAHAPYLSRHSTNKLCVTCLEDGPTCGEFDTVIEWALHVEKLLPRGAAK